MDCKPTPSKVAELDKAVRICDSLSNVTAREKTEEPRHVNKTLTDRFHGPQKLERPEVCLDAVTLHRLWSETDRHLDGLARSVRECKSVVEASNFCRWLQFSGILEILEKNSQPFPLPVDGAALRKKMRDVLYDCGEHFRTGKADPKYAASDIAEINSKLDKILVVMGNVSPPISLDTASAGSSGLDTALRVIPGGVIQSETAGGGA